jgi:hypothetical protein
MLSLFKKKPKVTKTSLREEFSIKEVLSDEGVICEDKVIVDDHVFQLLDTDGGYTHQTVRKMVAKHAQEVQDKVILIRAELPNLNRGVAFTEFGLYIETGEKVVEGTG